MKFIHTGDWHLGNKLFEIDRTDEFKYFLQWLLKKIENEKTETLIICGDIFDVKNPSNEAIKIYYNFLAKLKNTSCKNIVIIAGNHDSANFLDTSKEILEVLNIHVISSISTTTIKQMVFELYDYNNNVCGICCAVPFVYDVESIKYGTDINDAFKKIYSEVYEVAKVIQNNRNIPIIATGHLYANDLEGRLSNSNSSIKTDDGTRILDVLGNIGNVKTEVFMENFDYVALGHIHYTTRVSKKENIRYSGSPFVLGFDECNLPHYVLDVDINTNKDLSKKIIVNKVEVPVFNKFIRLEGTLEEIKDQLIKLKNIEPQNNTYIEIYFEKQVGVNIQEELDEYIKNLSPKYNVVSWKRKTKDQIIQKNFFDKVNLNEIKNLTSENIFTSFILSKLDSKEDKEASKKIIEEYLPLFIQIEEEVQSMGDN